MYLAEFQDSPIIMAVKNDAALKKSIEFDIPIVFLLYGDLMTLPKAVAHLKKHDKIVLVHLDFILGLSNHEIVLTYVRDICHADGIITTKRNLIDPARKLGLISILRFFVIDHLSLDNIITQVKMTKPDLIEVLPALIPRVIAYLREMLDVPIVTGGMVASKDDIIQALNAGALCVSASAEEVWSW